MAYCLVGILNVTLLISYGEEPVTAFLRLQEATINKAADETIFAWRSDNPGNLGLLAEAPDWFIDCSKMTRRPGPASSVTITSHGVEVSLHINEMKSAFASGTYYNAFLDWINLATGHCPSFTLVSMAYGKFARKGALNEVPFENCQRMPITVPQVPSEPDHPLIRFHGTHWELSMCIPLFFLKKKKTGKKMIGN
ncbi:putative Heterokaryon incompatibility domain-containing protein [Seiridium unicorne]|uniref:Heterokaryon incompatibility domain-containing protein n=1 Tax=Seiridium unicorne TaxID=138068 RepID=A0ABR2VDV5_9PEZI